MKFEHVLQIYWTKGFFFGGTLFYTNQTLPTLLLNTPGLSNETKKLLNQRFELNLLLPDTKKLLPTYENETSKVIIKPLNVFLSQIHTVNSQYTDLLRLIIMRLYLIKSYKGRCHAIGKPVRGQRTWSNAWGSYNDNKVLRYFISEVKRKSNSGNIAEKINYKVVKKKYPSKKKNTSETQTKTSSKWF
jgi:hypothetical protein